MKIITPWCFMVLLAVTTARAQDVVTTVSWSRMPPAVALPGKVVGEELKIENTSDLPMTARIFTIEKPGIVRAQYALRSEIRYENVQGGGYVEMWNYFPDGGAYFSRTLGDTGPMGVLTGSSPGRSMVLPFFNKPDGAPPVRLEVNVFLPGRGTVYVGPLELVQFASAGQVGLMARDVAGRVAWWEGWQAGVIGGTIGSVLGILVSVVGRLAVRGQSRSLVLGLLAGITVLGLPSIVVGVVAWRLGQPPHVYLVLLGLGIAGLVCGLNIPNFLRLFRQAEARRMQAQDA